MPAFGKYYFLYASPPFGYAQGCLQFNNEAFNESVYLHEQIEDYKKLMSYYPELVQTDDIYMTPANRNYLKEHGVQRTGQPLGRKPKKEKVSRYQKEKQRKKKAERNQIE